MPSHEPPRNCNWVTLTAYGENSYQHKNIVAKLHATLGNQATIPPPRVIQVVLIIEGGDVGVAALTLSHRYSIYPRDGDLVFFGDSSTHGGMVRSFHGAMKDPQITIDRQRNFMVLHNNDGAGLGMGFYGRSRHDPDASTSYDSDSSYGSLDPD